MWSFIFLFCSYLATYYQVSTYRYTIPNQAYKGIKLFAITGTSSRKQHTNKYSSFSKSKEDPLVAAIKDVEEKEAIKKSATVVTGTTVPTFNGSNAVNISLSMSSPQFDDAPPSININISNVIPNDPSTFGYTEIGRIVNAHGVKGEVKAEMQTDFSDFRLRNNSIVFLKNPLRRAPRPIRIIYSRKTIDNIYIIQFQHIHTRVTASLLKKYTIYIKQADRPPLEANEYLIQDLIGLKCFLIPTPRKEEEVKISVSSTAPKKIIPSNRLRARVLNKVDNNIDSDNHNFTHSSSLKSNEELTRSTNKTEWIEIGEIVGVVPPDELCDPAVRLLMHAQLEIQLISSAVKLSSQNRNTIEKAANLCLIPFVPSIVPVVNLQEKYCILEPPEGLLELTYAPVEKVIIRGYLVPHIDRLTEEDRRRLNAKVIFCTPISSTSSR
jgi:ribosomal 30S subunit maturation factor RimM